jgi:hypothetical protein
VSDPATRQDIKDAIAELKQWMLEREITTIRWAVGLFFGIQLSYFAITLGVVYFALAHSR